MMCDICMERVIERSPNSGSMNRKKKGKQHQRKYQRILEWVKDNISSGSFTPGEKLPTEELLRTRFGVSRDTVRRALGILVDEKLVETRQGSGIYVRESVPKRKKIAFITYTLNNYIFPEIMEGIYDEIQKQNADLLLYRSDYSVEQERHILEALGVQKIAGIIITPVYYQGLEETNRNLLKALVDRGTSVVFLDNYYPSGGFYTLGLDDYHGGIRSMEYLYSMGHRRVGLIFGTDHYPTYLRIEGAKDFLLEKGVPGEEIPVHSVPLADPYLHKNEMQQFLENVKNGISAVFCSNDQIAVFVIKQARSLGIKIPDDLSVMGFDNSSRGRNSVPPLSGINHPKKVLGRLAAQAVFSLIENPGISGGSRVLMEPQLVEGGSVRELNSE